MTGPLAQQFAQVREALHFCADVHGDRTQPSVDAAAALSVIERHVQDMEKTLSWYAERRNYMPPAGAILPNPTAWVFQNDSFDGEGPGARARAALPAREKGEE